MYNLARQLLFKLSPETSHDLSLDLIGAGGRLGLNGLLSKSAAKLPVSVMGLEFPNPVGWPPAWTRTAPPSTVLRNWVSALSRSAL
ncbi:hypothetical protein PSA5_13600 [Pseudomonas syringae pv. actinidiae]|nr:hypothetical protein PSA5_13600 [Pseudomonas syringae pv. actinidiae]